MKHILITILFANIFHNCLAQVLKRTIPLKEDSANKVGERFEYITSDGYAGCELLLKSDYSYEYKTGTDLSNNFSLGTWKKSKRFLILNSAIKKNDLPVRITYGNNGTFEKNFKIAVIKNINGEFIPGFVLVNNDSNKCDPSLGLCNESFEKINRVKVVLENGLSSKWIEVEKPDEGIVLTLMTEFSLFTYLPMDNVKFKIRKNSLERR